jgi:hypothetical protein
MCVQGMKVEIDFEGGKNAAGIYVHKRLPEAMGNSVAAFAHAVLSGQTQPGVWYPEEKEALAVSFGVGWGGAAINSEWFNVLCFGCPVLCRALLLCCAVL